MCHGEYESMKVLHETSPSLAPKPYAWGRYNNHEDSSADAESYFLLTDFRRIDFNTQPPDPQNLTARLAHLHQTSISPTGLFGFHTTTCHATIPQVTDTWGKSLAVLYRRQLGHMLSIELAQNGRWKEYEVLCDLTLTKVIPRLLEPLQSPSEGRNIKPCLVHGDCWDGNTATDAETGEPFIFDAGSFYAHNEYEIGNWRAARHTLSQRVYVDGYKSVFPVSEPVEDWDGRNLLYSLRFNTGHSILVPGDNQRHVVYEGMKELCLRYCPGDLRRVLRCLPSAGLNNSMRKEEEEEKIPLDERVS